MKQILITIALLLSLFSAGVEDSDFNPNPSLQPLVTHLMTKWHKKESEAKDIVLAVARETTLNPGFPYGVDLLAIAQVESGFRPEAVSSSGVGLLQLNHKRAPRTLRENVARGAEMLRETAAKAGTASRTLVAYNAGLGGLNRICGLKVRAGCETGYSRKVNRAREELSEVIRRG